MWYGILRVVVIVGILDLASSTALSRHSRAVPKPYMTVSSKSIDFDDPLEVSCLSPNDDPDYQVKSVEIGVEENDIWTPLATVSGTDPPSLGPLVDPTVATATGTPSQLTLSWMFNAIKRTTIFKCRVEVQTPDGPTTLTKGLAAKVAYMAVKRGKIQRPKISSTPDKVPRQQSTDLTVQCSLDLTYLAANVDGHVETVTCPEGWTLLDEGAELRRCYQANEKGQVSFEEAKSICQADGASLAHPGSPEQFEFVKKIAPDTWIEEPPPMEEESAGTGSLLGDYWAYWFNLWQDWHSFWTNAWGGLWVPHIRGKRSSTCKDIVDGQVEDVDCDSRHNFVCEKDATVEVGPGTNPRAQSDYSLKDFTLTKTVDGEDVPVVTVHGSDVTVLDPGPQDDPTPTLTSEVTDNTLTLTATWTGALYDQAINYKCKTTILNSGGVEGTVRPPVKKVRLA